jgi:hypothetical protein
MPWLRVSGRIDTGDVPFVRRMTQVEVDSGDRFCAPRRDRHGLSRGRRAVIQLPIRILPGSNVARMALAPFVEPPAPMFAQEIERYARQVLIPDVGARVGPRRRPRPAQILS